jgi:hypothetical protein
MRGRWYLLLLAGVAVVCVGLAQTRPGHAVLGAAGLYEKPATYTELAFSTPGALPSTLSKSGARVNVSFDIHNVSDNPRSYNWSIALVRSGASHVEASGAASAPAQGRTAITKSVTATCASGRVEVVVHLASPADSISFWMTCPPAAGKKRAAK